MDEPPVLQGFEHIRRYWDQAQQCLVAKILPGQFYVTRTNEAVTTSLGSCVSACIRDPVHAVGGMNHFMLPKAGDWRGMTGDGLSEAARYGAFAMEQLINAILKAGGRREYLEIKLVGGGHVLGGVNIDIGKKNIRFAREYVASEGLPVVAADLGGNWPRRVVYFPASGRVRVRKLRSQQVLSRERAYREQLGRENIHGEVELF